jgi:hypothetical protein
MRARYCFTRRHDAPSGKSVGARTFDSRDNNGHLHDDIGSLDQVARKCGTLLDPCRVNGTNSLCELPGVDVRERCYLTGRSAGFSPLRIRST